MRSSFYARGFSLALCASTAALVTLAACVAPTDDAEIIGSAASALRAPVVTAGPLVNAEDSFRCDDIEGSVIAGSVADVQAAVRWAAATRRSVKVSSTRRGGHSATAILCPARDGLVVNVADLNAIAIDAGARTVTVGPGVTVDELSAALDAQGLAIPTMADYTGVTIAGAIATSAHGSSLRIRASMATMVLGMKVVDGAGEVVELAGEDVLTGAAHVGFLGAVVEVTLRVEPQFKLRYGDDIRSDRRLEADAESLVRAHDYARIHWFPEHQRYVLDYFDRVDVRTKGSAYNNSWTQSGMLAKVVGELASRAVNDTPTNDVQCLVSAVRSSWWIANYAGGPLLGRPVGLSHEMLGGSCAPGTCAWDGPVRQKVRSVEVAFPLSKMKAWMGDVRAILAKSRACFPLFGIYMRFSKGSDVALDMAQGADTVLFEIHVLESISLDKIEMSSAAYDEIQQMTIAKYEGRPHWGKNETPAFVGVGPRAYPRWSEFEALRGRLDPRGTFVNELHAHVADGTPVDHAPGCAVRRTCVCDADEDCGPGLACSPGFSFTSARVCRKAAGQGCLRGYECASRTCTLFRCR